MSNDSVQVNIFFLLVGTTIEEQIQNARKEKSKIETIPRNDVNQPTIALDVKETEFFSTPEVEQSDGTPEKQSFIHDFRVERWEQVNKNTWNAFLHPWTSDD
ncbi:MAG: hypothetical protein IIA82_08170 [Thaumarchaeota archaeon]|nr:hypothetical protein [Nitrososphaerota archaeon]